MRQATSSSFNEGLLMDMNPLVTPQTCLTDCLNGTLITYNGNEFTLQNDMGNVKLLDSEITQGFIPIGMKEYGGIIYLALFNPDSNECEIGSIPSPSFDQSASGKDETINISNKIIGSETAGFQFESKFYKLFEPEKFEINPGDKYAIGYTIQPTTLNIFDKEQTCLYNVEIFAIDENNKQFKLEDPNLIDLTDKKVIIGSDYKYFNHTIKSILGLKISLNEIDFFDASVFEKDDNFHFQFYGKNKFIDDDKENNDLCIQGCRITSSNGTDYVYAENNQTGYVNAPTFNEKALMSKFGTDGDIIEFVITPFDQYKYLNINKKLSLKLGNKLSESDLINVYKYTYNKANKVLRLDFDAPVFGMVDPHVYIEFYDVWSDISVCIPLEDPSPMGVNTMFIDTEIGRASCSERVYVLV